MELSTVGLQLEELVPALIQRAACLSKLLLRRIKVEVSRTEAGVLQTLSVRPRRITELATPEVVTQPAITLIVKRLGERGWVERATDPSDGRAVLVTLTDAGRQVIDELRAEYRKLLQRELRSLPDNDLKTRDEILEELSDRLMERDS